MLKIKSKLYALFALVLTTCVSVNEEEVKLAYHQYGDLSFSTTQDWLPYKEAQELIVFFKKTDNDSLYRPNFSILLFKEDSNIINQSLDEIMSENIGQLNEVYAKYMVISYDTISTERYEGRKVSYGAIT
ncbi:MAG: hypothetical protein H0X62_14675, partial [Bacteroidetes bacterium]|nr:hypothetical protein [Bacteroidota bacterium]